MDERLRQILVRHPRVHVAETGRQQLDRLFGGKPNVPNLAPSDGARKVGADAVLVDQPRKPRPPKHPGSTFTPVKSGQVLTSPRRQYFRERDLKGKDKVAHRKVMARIQRAAEEHQAGRPTETPSEGMITPDGETRHQA